ncbi:hypothetical protein RIR_jg19300.t2 [Rhizophagus irregularis DAOM 181602=DAOM 197198]|nr:hypothetical protein RIR_jg19300.t2 [Rhizophagus irregularis DAOM 181602=DAOM 197198]CAB4485089.1 unnamed protein product [Rhizophagus irregularis]
MEKIIITTTNKDLLKILYHQLLRNLIILQTISISDISYMRGFIRIHRREIFKFLLKPEWTITTLNKANARNYGFVVKFHKSTLMNSPMPITDDFSYN